MIVIPSNVSASSQVVLRDYTYSVDGNAQAMPTHDVGDVVYAFFSVGGTHAKPTPGGSVPDWTLISSVPNKTYVWRAVMTSSSMTLGFDPSVIWFGAAVSASEASTTDFGEARTYSTGTGNVVLCPSVTMRNTDGTSQILHFAHCQHNSSGSAIDWVDPGATGYTEIIRGRFNASGNATGHLYALYSKDDTTSDGTVGVGKSTPNFTLLSTASAEITAQ